MLLTRLLTYTNTSYRAIFELLFCIFSKISPTVMSLSHQERHWRLLPSSVCLSQWSNYRITREGTSAGMSRRRVMWVLGREGCPTPQWQKGLFHFRAQNGEIWCILGAIIYSSAPCFTRSVTELMEVIGNFTHGCCTQLLDRLSVVPCDNCNG